MEKVQQYILGENEIERECQKQKMRLQQKVSITMIHLTFQKKSIVQVVSLPCELAIMCTDANEGAMRTHHMTLKRQWEWIKFWKSKQTHTDDVWMSSISIKQTGESNGKHDEAPYDDISLTKEVFHLPKDNFSPCIKTETYWNHFMR